MPALRAARVAALAALGACALGVAGASATAASTTVCDADLPSRACLLPFPNDQALTKPDRRAPTGRRVALPQAVLPTTKKGEPWVPTEWNRNDGFSPGTPIVLHLPQVETPAAFARQGFVTIADLSRFDDREQRVLLLDARTGQRQPIFAELDAQARTAEDRHVLIHPARNLREGRRYVVVVRALRGPSGRRVPAPPRWQRAVERSQPAVRRLLPTLARAKVLLRDVHLAWDFTVGSERSLTGRLLAMRDETFARLGDRDLADRRVQGRAPAFTVDRVEEVAPADDARIARKVTGTVAVPCYLDRPGCPPGARMRYATSRPGVVARPSQAPGNLFRAEFVCNVPRIASPDAPARLSLYGHGLLGRPTEIDAGNVRDFSQEENLVFCATRWAGMSAEDVPNAAAILQRLDRFPSLADRLQQGVLNALVLGRLMHHPQGLASHPAFQVAGRPVVDTRALFFDGNSQGGIIGPQLVAASPDVRRGVVGVPGMRYALLLPRSVDFDAYLAVLRGAYDDPGEYQIMYALLQQLWDRGEANGWIAHATTDPPANTPAHELLWQVAIGDHQVAPITADIAARTVGARTTARPIAPGRTRERSPLFAIPRLSRFPATGSAITYWDTGPGNVPPPLSNTPPRAGEDPHESVRATRAARVQKSAFLRSQGQVVDPCAGRPCRTDDFRP